MGLKPFRMRDEGSRDRAAAPRLVHRPMCSGLCGDLRRRGDGLRLFPFSTWRAHSFVPTWDFGRAAPAAVKAGVRPPPRRRASGLDGGEHGRG